MGSPRNRGSAAAWAAIIVVALALVAFTGCSGDGSETEADPGVAAADSEQQVSREEVVSEGDAICAEVNAAIAGLSESATSPSVQMSQRADLYAGMVERLRGLEDEDPALTEMFAAGRDLVQAAVAAEDASAEGDAFAASSAEEDLEEALERFRSAAADYGFEDCAGEPADTELTVPGDEGDEVAPGAGAAPGDPGGTAAEGGGSDGGEPAPGGGAPPEPADPDGAPAGGGEPEGGGGGAADGGGDSTGGFSPG